MESKFRSSSPLLQFHPEITKADVKSIKGKGNNVDILYSFNIIYNNPQRFE